MTDITSAASAGGFDLSAGKLLDFIKKSDLGLAIGIMAILVVLILPLPTWLLDVALAFSLSFSILILMTAVFIRKPLEFSSFPAILLITTMLRLALNLASTRLILGHGTEGTAASGYVIQAFGKLIMQGNFVIGLIVFAILIIVNFVSSPRLGPHRRSGGAFQPGRDARQADGDRRRSFRRPDRREGSQAAPQDHRSGIQLLRRHGRRLQIRARRRHCRPSDRGHQRHRRHHHRRGAEGHELRRRHPDLHASHRG